ncbi:unnamed protein product [Penicillium salamii]|nr:unnamed protein product [Penicillium salamii]
MPNEVRGSMLGGYFSCCSAMAMLPVPSGLTPPLTANNETNHNGVITIIASFALFIVLGSLGIRVYSAYSRRVQQLDDLSFAATVVCLGASYSADILYAAVLSSSKVSTALFYRTITLRSSSWMSYTLLTTMIVSAPITIVLLSVRCDKHPWRDINDECKALFSHWKAITTIDIFLEVALLLYPIQSILRLQTTLGKKMTVILVLSCRALLIPVVAVHLYYIGKQMRSPDPTLEGTYATIVAELHVALSLVVLIAPLMKPFIAAYVDENGLAYTDELSASCNKPKLVPRSGRSDGTDIGAQHGTSPSTNRIMKSIHISVDRGDLELSQQSKNSLRLARDICDDK